MQAVVAQSFVAAVVHRLAVAAQSLVDQQAAQARGHKRAAVVARAAVQMDFDRVAQKGFGFASLFLTSFHALTN